MGSAVLPHLRTGWHVDQAIMSEEERLVVIRFGRDHNTDCRPGKELCSDLRLVERLTHARNTNVIAVCDLGK